MTTTIEQKLPFELLPKIFRYSVLHQCNAADNGLCLPHSSRAPLLLLRVCRTWSSIATSTPDLWTTMKLSISAQSRNQFSSLIEIWLKRSKTDLLTIWVDIGSKAHVGNALSLLKVISSHSDHWRDITLSMEPQWEESLGHLLQRRLPALESLNIVPHDVASLDTVLQRLQCFSDTPMLYKFTFSAAVFPFVAHFRWAQLTDLTCHKKMKDFESICLLQNCPLLVRCTIRSASGHESIPFTKRVEMKYLKFLNFVYGGQNDRDMPLAESLLCPVLKDLQWRFTFMYWSQSPVKHFLTGTLGLLSHLCLAFTEESFDMTYEEMLECFQLTPNLVSLKMKGAFVSRMSSSVLKRLTYRENSGGQGSNHVLLPRLEHLTMRNLNRHLDTLALLDMVESRSKHIPTEGEENNSLTIARMRYLNLRPCDHFIRVAVREFEQLKFYGVVVTLSYSHSHSASTSTAGIWS